MNQKQGILVVSFGTSYREAFEKNIVSVEREIQNAYPSACVRRAFTSRMIIKKLAAKDQFHVDTVSEALEGFLNDGCTELLVQPTHIINGNENDSMLETLCAYRSRFTNIRVGAPLLSGKEDCQQVIDALTGHYAGLGSQNALVFMGHGTAHHADFAYPALDYMCKASGHANIHIATVEGYPTLEEVKASLRIQKPKQVILAPLMLVAGDHAANDMAGDNDDSWKSQLEHEGFSVSCRLEGLGEYPEIRALFLDHLKNAKTL